MATQRGDASNERGAANAPPAPRRCTGAHSLRGGVTRCCHCRQARKPHSTRGPDPSGCSAPHCHAPDAVQRTLPLRPSAWDTRGHPNPQKHKPAFEGVPCLTQLPMHAYAPAPASQCSGSTLPQQRPGAPSTRAAAARTWPPLRCAAGARPVQGEGTCLSLRRGRYVFEHARSVGLIMSVAAAVHAARPQVSLWLAKGYPGPYATARTRERSC